MDFDKRLSQASYILFEDHTKGVIVKIMNKNCLKQTTLYARGLSLLLSAVVATTGCSAEAVVDSVSTKNTSSFKVEQSKIKGLPTSYKVDPENFALSLGIEKDTVKVSGGGEKRTVKNYKESNNETSWKYPDAKVSVKVKPVEDYLNVSITSESETDNTFTWPQIGAEQYYLPLGEGKRIPAKDTTWKAYLSGEEVEVMEQLSMPFWATSSGKYAVLFVMENPYRTHLDFSANPDLSFSVTQSYPKIDKNRTKSFRIYITENNSVNIAKLYRNYVIEQGNFVTLAQKAEKNPEIKKLYGAPFIYLWGDKVISAEDVKWQAFRKLIGSPIMEYLLSFSNRVENGAEFATTVKKLKKQDYVDDYQRNVICNYISVLLRRDDFFNSKILSKHSPMLDNLLKKGYKNMSESKKIQTNKYALAVNLPDVFNAPSDWMNGDTVNLIRQLKESGINQAWLGLHEWEQAFAKPELVNTAVEQGFLIGSYDSYHSIHEPGKAQWSTADFDDTSLYEKATVTNIKGEKIRGFQNVGRKLNPTLALPSVKKRTKTIIEENQLHFNSWFVDCDGTGEIYDDYTPEHITTQQEDLAARLERMAYIRDTYGLVVGSEGGNDFAASTIAFAHGIELKSFSWMDDDMKSNKTSEYYVGRYFNAKGGVAEHFSKRVPLKDYIYTLFVDPRYDIPLFKLVYNESMISAYHWEWPTFKIKGATQDRMLREVLYNVPPLYHLDGEQWAEYKADIVSHNKVWAEFSKQVIQKEMTDFADLTKDGSVQRTQYGKDIQVIANFSDISYQYKNWQIPKHSVLIDVNGNSQIYTPRVSPKHE